MHFDAYKFGQWLKSCTDCADSVVRGDKWQADQYAWAQARLIDAMPLEQLQAIHTCLTHPDTEKNPIVFCEMDPASAYAILREANGMKLFITPAGDCLDSFLH